MRSDSETVKVPVIAPVRTASGRVGLALAFALLVAVSAQIRLPLPFTPVPFTFQVFIVALAAYQLGAWWGAASLGLYIGMGAAGAPVFSGGAAGLAALGGVTAGYLLSYPLAAGIIGWLASRAQGVGGRVGAGLAGLAVIHAGGVLWMWAVVPAAPHGTMALLTWTLLPFVGVDIVKVLVAERLSRR
ncbi:MAG: biotin transporter BioY [Acidobacteriota bacterium]